MPAEENKVIHDSSDDLTVIELKASKLTSKEFIQIEGIDPSHALLYSRYGEKYMVVLLNPQWFAQAMLKLSNSNIDVLDPAGTLISIRYKTTMSSILPHPDWLASAMVKLSCTKKSNVGDQYPLPPKVQKATIEYDFVAVAKRMDMLSVCTLQESNAIVLDSGLDFGS